MAWRLKRPCLYPGCPEVVDGGGYCPHHKKTYKRDINKQYDKQYRSNNYSSSTWEKVRNMKLKRNPLCELCMTYDRVIPARIVHHITPIKQGGSLLDLTNLMSVCRRCHDVLHSKKGKELTERVPTPGGFGYE
jgi:5-methylcytosine-specific restriction protein A